MLVTFKKTATYPIVEEKFFQLEGLARLVYPGIAYIYESPNLFESGYWESHDKDEFRQAAWLVFERGVSFESHVRHLEKLEFVKSVKPLYYPEVYLDRETYDKYEEIGDILYYLGTYNGYDVIEFYTLSIYPPRLEVIGGIKFYSAIELYKEREYIYLSDAYKDGLVSAEDVFLIFYHACVKSLLQYPNVID